MLRVMLVDDESMALEGLKILIDWEKHGFEVSAMCSSGEEALNEYDNARPDLVVTDLYMPNIDGIALMSALRARGFAGQFLIVSGFSDFEKARQAMSYHVADYLLKPIDTAEADKAIERAVEMLLKDRALEPGAATLAPRAVHADEALLSALSQRQERLSDTVKRLAQARSSESLTLEALADQIGYNAAYLGRAFHDETGMSFRVWLSEYRMGRAAELLKTTSASIREIAATTGYRKYQNFLQTFKAKYSVSPQEFRKRESGG